MTLNNNLICNGFTISAGTLLNPATAKVLTTTGDLSIADAAKFGNGGSNLSVVLSGSDNQNLTVTAGSMTTPLTINKTAGKVTLLSNYTGSGAGGTITVSSGALFINGKVVSATTTVGNAGEFQLRGSEIFTTPTFSASSTVTYVGSGNATTTKYWPFFSTYPNLKVAFTDSSNRLMSTNMSTSSTLSNGLAGYWKLDESTTSATILDSSTTTNPSNGLTYNMTTAPSGPTTTIPTAINFYNTRSLNFDGTNDYMLASLNSSLITNTATFSFWVNTNQTEATWVNTVIGLGSTGTTIASVCVGGTYSDTYTAAKSICLYNSSLGSCAVTNSFTTTDYGAWHHIVITYDKDATPRTKIYKDNNLLNMYSNYVTGAFPSQNQMNIGRRADASWYWNGAVDDVRIYNRVLTAGEITSLYTGFTGTEAFPISPINIPGNFSLSGGSYFAGVATTTTIGGNFTQTGGIFNSSSTLKLGGNFTQTGGTLNTALATLKLTGADQIITHTGTTTFAALTKSATGDPTLYFSTSTDPLIITGTTTFVGTVDNLLYLRSVATGTQWKFDPQGPRVLAYLDVQDSNNVNATVINAQSYTSIADSGNNTGWSFTQPIMTVSSPGSQLSTTSIPTTNQNLGGAFTFSKNSGTSTVTSITLHQSGSYPSSNITSLKLWYQATTTCASVKPLSGITQFGTGSSSFTNGYATTTGSLDVGPDNVCLYATYSIPSSFATSTLGQTVNLDIANPSTDILASGATVNPSTTVGITGQTIIVLNNATLPSNPNACTNSNITSVLSLHMNDQAKDPTVFYLQNCAVWELVGAGAPLRLTNPNLQVQTLTFTQMTGGTVRIEITMSNMNPGNESTFLNVTRSYGTTATVKAWNRE